MIKLKRKEKTSWRFKIPNASKDYIVTVEDMGYRAMFPWSAKHRQKEKGMIGNIHDPHWDMKTITMLRYALLTLYGVKSRLLVVRYDGKIGGFFVIAKNHPYHDKKLGLTVDNFLWYAAKSTDASTKRYLSGMGKAEKIENGILKSVHALNYAIMYAYSNKDKACEDGSIRAWLHAAIDKNEDSINRYKKGFAPASPSRNDGFFFYPFRKDDGRYFVSNMALLKKYHDSVMIGVIK